MNYEMGYFFGIALLIFGILVIRWLLNKSFDSVANNVQKTLDKRVKEKEQEEQNSGFKKLSDDN